MADKYSKSSDPKESSGIYWRDQIKHAQKTSETWEKRGDRVVSRYRDEREAGEQHKAKENILWSNVQVMSPSLYGRPAKPEVSRRYQDSDPVGRLASMMLERTLQYEIEQFPSFEAAMSGAVEDRLLPGRGTAWLRLDTADIGEGAVDKEYSPVEYVYWKDFLHSPARTWEEVWWVARAVYLTKEKGVERFGREFANVPVSEHKEETGGRKDRSGEKDTGRSEAKVWEIWNKRTKKVCWIADGYTKTLDEKDDPLRLEGFFPCPEPLFATTTTGTLIPVPDYIQYQDQATELDSLTGRIEKIVKAIKAVGVYNKEFTEVARLLTEGVDNQLFGVQNWMALAEKNGLKGNIELLDLTTQIQALGALYTAREQVKQTIYEICGISDIVRGSTKAEETLGAQEFKVQFGSLRLRNSQKDVARFASEIIRLKAQIICKFYPPEVIAQMSGIQGTADGQNQEKLAAAFALLQNSTVRDFLIAVESDTLAQIDEDAEKAAAVEMVTAVGTFMKGAMEAVQAAPELLPMTESFLKGLIVRFKAGREHEAAIEQSFEALKQGMIQRAQNPPPSPEVIQAQAQIEAEKMRAQVDTQGHIMKSQADKETQQAKLAQEAQLEKQKSSMEKDLAKLEGQIKLAIEQLHSDTERYKAELQAQTQLAVAQMSAQAQLQTTDKKIANEQDKNGVGAMKKERTEITTQVGDVRKQLEAFIADSKRPRSKKVIRDKDGKITGIKEESNEVH